MRILVIEDDEVQRVLALEVLLSQGFAAEGAADGEEGLRQARALMPDLVMLDVMMPGLDGFAVCRAFKADPALKDIPVLIVTGLEDTTSIERGFDSGAKDFMTKPINWGLLGYRIRFLLRASEMRRELQVAKEAAEASSAAKSAFFAMVTHELRTPLNAIIGFSDVMRLGMGGEPLPERYRGYVDDINDSGVHLLSLINDVLEMSRLDRSSVDLQEDSVELGTLLDGAMAELKRNAEAGGITLAAEVAGAETAIWADAGRLTQAIGRLLSNAIKFSPKGSTVTLRAELADGRGPRITIRDTGIGMTKDGIARIEQPFYQADMRLDRSYGGLGLGVPLALGVIKLHGGTLTYESAPGEGTTAIITLPESRALPQPSLTPAA